VFDSLGIDEDKLKNLKLCLKFKTISTLEYNETAFQSDATESCGLFVLYYIFERLHNFDLTLDMLLEDIFENNCNENEEKVTKFCKNIILSESEEFQDGY
jgi:hypothetical protein